MIVYALIHKSQPATPIALFKNYSDAEEAAKDNKEIFISTLNTDIHNIPPMEVYQ